MQATVTHPRSASVPVRPNTATDVIYSHETTFTSCPLGMFLSFLLHHHKLGNMSYSYISEYTCSILLVQVTKTYAEEHCGCFITDEYYILDRQQL